MHLYEYLLSHNRQYSMDVIRMDPFIQDDRAEKEHILVQLSPHKVVYRNHQESIWLCSYVDSQNDYYIQTEAVPVPNFWLFCFVQDAPQVGDYDVFLIISHDLCGLGEKDKSIMSLKVQILHIRELQELF